MNTIIETKNITRVYDGTSESTQALRGVNIAIEKGESVAIIGKSGSGKSTLMHVLATLDRPTSGQLFINGTDTTQLSTKDMDKLRNRTFGFVFQQFFLNARNTCLENVVLPLTIMGVPVRERNELGLRMLEAVGLAAQVKQRAGDLSGGQKQRLCIARALVTRPAVIFADEPTGNLDSENGRNIVELLFKLQREQGITLIIVTHDPDLAVLCGRTITLKDGQVVSGGAI